MTLASSCGTKEAAYLTAYTFHNGSSYDITMEVRNEFIESRTDVIAKGQSLTMYSQHMGEIILIFLSYYGMAAQVCFL